MRIRLLSIAESELAVAADYYETQASGLGEEFLSEALQAIGRIRSNPEAWCPISEKFRRCRLHRFPYGMIYEIRSYEIIIVSLMHLHREPRAF